MSIEEIMARYKAQAAAAEAEEAAGEDAEPAAKRAKVAES
jgi:hypothetical protein|tara:strand:+ start:495 stop:614 length:120 start_codon:yes stop_codon:yes gene_type:complete